MHRLFGRDFAADFAKRHRPGNETPCKVESFLRYKRGEIHGAIGGERRGGKSISSSFYLSPLLFLAMRDRVKRESRAGKEERGSGRDRAVFTTTRKKNLFAMVV